MKLGAVHAGVAVLGGIVLLLAGVLFALSDLQSPTWVGIGAGALLGSLNLVIGSALTGRALRKSHHAVLRTMLGGFLVRLLVLVGLIVLFHRQSWINEIAFALAFMIFFCLFLALEIRLIERSLRRPA